MSKAPRIAFLDNGPNPDRSSGLAERFQQCGFQVDRYWAFSGSFPVELDGFDGVLLSGSPHGAYEDIPFIHREHDFIERLAARRIPTLGLCFGSQILGSALCGRDQVFRRKTCEVGHVDLDMTDTASRDELTEGNGRKVRMFVWHNDEVRAGHPDMVILAATPDCPNHIWRYRDLPMWGIQGHPEVTKANAAAWMGESRAVLARDGADPDALIREARDSVGGLRMLDNFLKICGHQTDRGDVEEYVHGQLQN